MQQQQHIHCIVNDCHYWAQGNKCNANEILVSTNDFAESQPDQAYFSTNQDPVPDFLNSCGK